MAETKAIAGYQGKVYVGAASSPVTEVAEIGHWTGTIALDAIETPKFQPDRTRIAGKRDFTGSFDGSWYLKLLDTLNLAKCWKFLKLLFLIREQERRY